MGKPFYDSEDGGHAPKVVTKKDETEEKLERLLFGDDAGFHEALKSHRTPGTMDLVLQADSDEEEGDGEEEGGLDDVADADVSGFFLLSFLCVCEGAMYVLILFLFRLCSFSSWIQELLMLLDLMAM